MTESHTRRLPHIQAIGRPMFITWRLHGSLPSNRSFPRATSETTQAGRVFLSMDRLLADARVGPTHLRTAEIASLVVESIRYRHLIDYDLHRFVVMPNHILVTPIKPVSKFLPSLKRFSAQAANRVPGTTGQAFWQDESYDRLVRDDVEFERTAKYIERNPVDAGIVAEPAQFRWSSAWPIANRPQVSNLPHDCVVVPGCHESDGRPTLPGHRDCPESRPGAAQRRDLPCCHSWLHGSDGDAVFRPG